MKKLYILFVIPIVLSCTFDIEYSYVQINRDNNTDYYEDELETIIASSDSLAYMKGYTKFLIAQKVANKMRDQYSYDYPKRPRGFLLYNSKGELVDDPIPVDQRDSIYTAIQERVSYERR